MEKTRSGRPQKNISCKDIFDIIKYGQEHNVARLSFGNLSIEYNVKSGVKSKPPLEAGQQPSIKDENSLLEDEIAEKEKELALMASEDPERFEEILASGELTESEDASENDSE
jgi:hypothetical protein